MSTIVLDASRDADAWKSVLERLPSALRDVYFESEYIALHALGPDERALLFVYDRGDDYWVYPFVLRAIPALPGVSADAVWHDIETAYGYGGPISTSDDAEFLRSAHREFREWATAEHVVAEFVRFHPLLENHRWMDPGFEIQPDRETIWLDLARLADGPKAFTGKAGNMLRRAEREGVIVTEIPAAEYVESFLELYRRTMARLGADSYYHFNDAYFAGLAKLATTSGWMLAAVADGAWVGAAFFLRGATWMHYHLSATDPDSRLPGVTNILLAEAAMRGHETGLRGLHLGGGRTRASDDSLLRFKQSMGSERVSFHIGKRVLDSAGYEALVSSWRTAYPQLVEHYGSRLLCYRETGPA